MKNSITLLLLLYSIIGLVPEASGEKFYWVGGSGTWNDPSFINWSKESGMTDMANRHTRLPGPEDEVIFDLNSFTGSGQIVNLPAGGTAQCLDFTWTNITGANSPTLHFPANATLEVYGTFSLDKDVKVSYVSLATASIVMKGAEEGTVFGVYGAGVKIPNIEFNAPDGAWGVTRSTTSPDTLKVAGTLRITEGTLSSSTGALTRYIEADYFVIDGANAGADLSNMDITAKSEFLVSNTFSIVNQNLGNTSSIKTPLFNIDAAGPFDFGALFLMGNNATLDADNIDFKGAVTLEDTISNTILGSHTFSANLVLNAPGALNKLEAGQTQTFSSGSTIVGTGASCSRYYYLQSTQPGSAAFVSKPLGENDVALERFYLQDIHAVEENRFSAALSVDLGNNDKWTFAATSSDNFYWIGGTGDWSDGTNWRIEGGNPGCLPTAVDNVIFDENSFDDINQFVTVDLPAIYFNNMTWTDPKVMGKNDFPEWSVPSADVFVGGSMTLAPTMTVAAGSGANFRFVAETGSQTITAEDDEGNGFDLNNISFEGAATWTLGGKLLAAGSISLQNGTLNTSTSNHDMEANTFSVNGSGASLTLNDSKIYTTTFEIQAISTLNAGTSNIYTETFEITPPGLTFYELILRGDQGILAGTDLNFRDVNLSNNVQSSVFGSHVYSNLLQFDKPGMIVEFEAGTTHQMGDLEARGGDCGDEIIVRSSQSGSQVFFVSTGGNISVTSILLQDNAASPPMSFSASKSQDLGNNSGWEFSNSAETRYFYWRGGTGDWNDGSNWRYATNLSQMPNQSNCVPTPSDDVIFDAESFEGVNDVVTLDGAEQYCRNMRWEGVTGVPTMNLPAGNSLNIYGGLNLLSGTSAMSLQFGDGMDAAIDFKATSTGNVIRTSGHVIPNLNFNGPEGGWSINGAIEVGAAINLINGELNTNGNKVEADQFVIDGANAGLILGGSDLDITDKVDINQINPANFDAGTSTITTNILESDVEGLSFNQVVLTNNPDDFDASPALNGNNLTFNTLVLQGILNNFVYGSHQYNQALQFDVQNNLALFYFEAGSIQTLGNDATLVRNSVQAEGLVIIDSGTPGATASFLKVLGAICLDYFRISNVVATGGAIFGFNTGTADAPTDLGWIATELACEVFLPVDCVDFAAAVREDNSVELYWLTAQEINNSGFEVQRSTDGRRFETIAWIDGAGTTAEAQKYTYIDQRTDGLKEAYYRIRQIDLDGTAAFACDIQAVNFRQTGSGPLQVFPNPAGNQAQIRWYGHKNGTTIIRLFDQRGRLVLDREWSTLQGNNQRALPLSDLPKGVYELQLVDENGLMEEARIVKQ